jgi:hypothetical protein
VQEHTVARHQKPEIGDSLTGQQTDAGHDAEAGRRIVEREPPRLVPERLGAGTCVADRPPA